MSCSTADGIGALTSPCQGGCGPKGPARRWFLADRINVTDRMQLGSQVNIKLDGVPLRDANKRFAHVVAFSLIGTLRLTTTDVTNTAVPGYQTLAKFSNFFLEDSSGWSYYAGNIDGRNLIDDVFMRNYQLTARGVGSDGIVTDVGTAQNNDITIRLHHSLTPMNNAVPSLRGAIPLASIKDRGMDAFRFTVAALPETYTNVTDGGFQGTFQAWIQIVYLPTVMTTAGWQLENYTKQDTSGRLRHADRMHEYVVIRPMPEDDASVDLTAYAGITVQVGDDIIVRALSATELDNRREVILSSDIYAVPTDLPQLLTETIQYFILVPRNYVRKAMGSGAVTFNYSTRTDSETRYLHRTIACQNGNRAKELARSALGCGHDKMDQVQAVPVDDSGNPTTTARDPGADLHVIPLGIALNR